MPAPSRRAEAVQLPIIPQVADWIRQHPGTLSLGQGVAGYAPPPQAWTELLRLREQPALHRYQPVGGLPELTQALAERWLRRSGVALGDERCLMVTAGANAAFLQAILAICDPGDEVILPVPYYFNQEMALALANVRPVLVPTDAQYHPDLDRLRAAVTARTRAVVTVSPNNPTGAVYPERCLRAINQFCGEQGLFHLSDETYEDFVYDGARHFSPGSFAGAAPHTISLYSFSKAYGFASWRVGYGLFPANLLESLRKIQDTHMICPPVASQLAALGCLQAGEAWLKEKVAGLSVVRRHVLAGLEDLRKAELIRSAPAEGAFYVLVTLPRGGDALELTHQLIREHRVAVIPGTAFGVSDECCLRLAYGALEPASVPEAVGRFVVGLRRILAGSRAP
ncbi:MAG: pyridoxal phosphate-dependent aminotransferase [Verrucomicrobiales bacterium]|nr:pyridoxal phosphate-dependent aminotransferase [Verrucomicrobiales bacterium]